MASAKTKADAGKTTGKKATPRKVSGRPRGITARGAEIIKGLEELCETLEAGIPVEQKFRVTYCSFDFNTPEYGPEDVKRVRATLSMSQAHFATFMGVDANTVQSWEQGVRRPLGMARRFMQEIEADPAYWKKRVVAAAVVREVRPKK